VVASIANGTTADDISVHVKNLFDLGVLNKTATTEDFSVVHHWMLAMTIGIGG
jgi:hypothetical protein|tara:strand:- start:446 stop:604 length:159 start_codon:yes stop_codon:yes gene_type:complete